MLPELEQIKVVVLDVDGVLTDGLLGYGSPEGMDEKFFHAHDGTGIALLLKAGINVAWLTGRCSVANQRRAKDLHIDLLKEGCRNKAVGMVEVAEHFGVKVANCAYLGDDLIDLPALEIAGLPVAVGDACFEVKNISKWVMNARGGHGAVREFSERFLKARGLWEKALSLYRGEQ